jgi:hypothetical protein
MACEVCPFVLECNAALGDIARRRDNARAIYLDHLPNVWERSDSLDDVERQLALPENAQVAEQLGWTIDGMRDIIGEISLALKGLAQYFESEETRVSQKRDRAMNTCSGPKIAKRFWLVGPEIVKCTSPHKRGPL